MTRPGELGLDHRRSRWLTTRRLGQQFDCLVRSGGRLRCGRPQGSQRPVKQGDKPGRVPAVGIQIRTEVCNADADQVG